MKARFVLSMFAAGVVLATQGLVGCGDSGSGTPAGTGGAKATGGAVGTGGVRATGGSQGTGGAVGTGGSTTARDAGTDGAQNRDANRPDSTVPSQDAATNRDVVIRRDTQAGETATACGGDGEDCCANRTCDNGLTCQGRGTGTCEAATTVDGGNRDTSTAPDTTPCGAQGEVCCANRTCDDGLTCERPAGGGDRTCEPEVVVDGGGNQDVPVVCGGLDEACCAGDTCDDGLTCRGRTNPTCREPAVDGGNGNGG